MQYLAVTTLTMSPKLVSLIMKQPDRSHSPALRVTVSPVNYFLPRMCSPDFFKPEAESLSFKRCET